MQRDTHIATIDVRTIVDVQDLLQVGQERGYVTSDEIMALVEAGDERVASQVGARGVPYDRHIVHIDDVVQAFGLILGNHVAIGRSFNIAGPSAFNYGPATEYLSEKTGIPVIDVPAPGYHSFEIDINRARTVLGYRPENDIFTMIDRALEWRESAR